MLKMLRNVVCLAVAISTGLIAAAPALAAPALTLSTGTEPTESIDRTELTLAINEVETACDVSIAMDAHKDYGLTAQQAESVLGQVQTAVHGWRCEANRLDIPKAERELMAPAFEP